MKVYYCISNDGDGSNSVHFSRKPFDAEKMELDSDRWGSGDGFQEGSFEITDGATITGIRWVDEDQWGSAPEDRGFLFLEE